MARRSMPIRGSGGKGAVKDIDHGYQRIREQLTILEGSATKVGIQAGEQRKGDTDGGERDMVQVAVWNEYGTHDGAGGVLIPPRPAHAQAFDQNKGTMQDYIAKQYDKVLTGTQDARVAISRIGLKFETIVKNQIATFTDPPNAESTQIKKGAKVGPGVMVDNPLEDTGQMRESVRHVEEFR